MSNEIADALLIISEAHKNKKFIPLYQGGIQSVEKAY